MLADLQGSPFYPLLSAELLKAVGWHKGSPQPAAASAASNSLLQNAKLQSCSKHLQEETEEGLQLGFAALPKTYKLLLFLIATSRLLSEVEGTACHSCCYLVFVIPLCTQVGTHNYCFVSLDFLLVLSNLIAITTIVGKKWEVQT